MDIDSKKVLTWIIRQTNNFYERTDAINSNPFSVGGTEWHLQVAPREYGGYYYLFTSLHIGHPKPLIIGRKERVIFYFVLLNQSGKEIYRSPNSFKVFCQKFPAWGYKTVSLTKLKEKGLLEDNKLTIKMYMQILKVVHQTKSTADEILYLNGFHINSSRALSVYNIFAEHPNFANNLKPKNQEVRTAYMNFLLCLINTLNKSPHNLFGTELSNAQSELCELTEVGFKLDWLKSKLEEISSERKRAISDGTWVQQLEECVKNLSEIKKESPFSELITKLFLSCFTISEVSSKTK